MSEEEKKEELIYKISKSSKSIIVDYLDEEEMAMFKEENIKLEVDKIYFDKNYNITLYFGDVRVYLGTSDYIDEKINRLRFILPELTARSGVLHMENYTGEGDKFTFTND